MGMEHIQSNLSGGEIAPTLHARVDIEKYQNSVAEAKNVVIVPQGGLRRRPGLAKVEDGYYNEEVRLVPFVFNQSQKYIIVFRPNYIDVIRDGALVKTGVASPYTTIDTIKELDIIQSADTMIVTHETVAPYSLVRGATDADWTMSAISLTIPTYDFGSGAEPVWSATRGYPAVCAFHSGRLWFAGSTQKPTSIWASRVNGFYDFTWVEDAGGIPDDHAIFDTLSGNELNKITNIFSARTIQVFTEGTEWINSIDFPTPSNSSWSQQTSYGSKRLRPIFIDGATLYIDGSGRTIRQFIYDFNEDAYVSNNITLLASHLLTDIKSISSIKGTNLDVSDYVYVVNTDGSLAVMNTLRSEGLLGWTHWETQGEFVDVVVIGKEVYFLVKREQNYFIEMLNEDTYTDHSVLITGTAPTTSNIVDGEDNIVDGGFNIVDTDYTTGSPVTSITTDYKDLFLNTYFKVIADFAIMADSKPISDGTDLNHFDIPRNAYRLEVGLDFSTSVLTLPLNTGLNNGLTLHRRKRVVKANMNVYESLGLYAKDIYAPDRQFTVILDQAPTPFTGFKEVYLLGYNRITQLEISQKEPLPMLIRAIGYEVAY